MQRPRSTRTQRPAPADYSGSGASSPPGGDFGGTRASPLSRTDSTQRVDSAASARSRSGSTTALRQSPSSADSPPQPGTTAQGPGPTRNDASRVSDASSPADPTANALQEQMQQLAQSAYHADQLNKRDKGKAVARAERVDPTARTGQIAEEDASGGDADELKRQQQIERVLKRAQAAKLARNFRNRIQLAAFKNQRGWQDVQLDVIEPHLEQEAQQRRLQAGQAASLASAEQATFGGLPGAAGPSSAIHLPSPHQQHAMYQELPHYASSHTPSDLYRPQLGGGMEAVLAGNLARYDDDYASASAISMRQQHPPPPKRARVEHPVNSSYNVHSVYAAPPVPPSTHTTSPYATTQVYAPTLASGSRYTQNIPPAPSARPGAQYEHGWDSRAVYATSNGHASARPSRAASHAANELYSLPMPAHHRGNNHNDSSPRTRSASRRSPPKKQPLSSTDPTFSSFVDAANALTGMARAPSDPAMSGAGSQGGNSDEGAGPRPRSSMEMSASHSGSGMLPPPQLSRHSSSSSSGIGQAPVRPSTPEQQVVKLPGAPNGGNNSAGDGATAEGAAELMLFLAASPSPVQARRTVPVPTLGDGMPKGRRLFSGTGDSGDTSFGGELDSFASTASANVSAPPSAKSSASSSVRPPFATASPSADPSKHRFGGAQAMTPSHSQQQTQVPPVPASNVVSTTPATPGRRQRQPSLAGAWESFINASPSPKRQRKSRGSGAAGGYPSENGELGLSSEGGIGGGPGNGQAQVTW